MSNNETEVKSKAKIDGWKLFWQISNIILGYGSYFSHIYTAYKFFELNTMYYFSAQVTIIASASFVSLYLICSEKGWRGFFIWFFQADWYYSVFYMTEDNRYLRNHYFVLLECIPAIFLTMHGIFDYGDQGWTLQASVFMSILEVAHHNMVVLRYIPLNKGFKQILMETYPGFFYVFVESYALVIFWGFFVLVSKPWGFWIFGGASLLVGLILFFPRWKCGEQNSNFKEYLSYAFSSALVGCFFTSTSALKLHNYHKALQYIGMGVGYGLYWDIFVGLFPQLFYLCYGIAGAFMFVLWFISAIYLMCSDDGAYDLLNLKESSLKYSRKLIPDGEVEEEEETDNIGDVLNSQSIYARENRRL